MKNHPRYFEIVSYIESYRYFVELEIKQILETKPRNNLELMIDISTGYDEELKKKSRESLKRIVIWLKTIMKLEKLIDYSEHEKTKVIYENIRNINV